VTDTRSAVANLQSRWHAIHDLDRAQAIKSIYQSGMTLRELAALLNWSPSLLTRLLQAAQAPFEDLVLARQGALSTRALVRAAKTVGIRRTALHREAIAFERERAALQESKSILNWLAEREVAQADREQVIEKARLYLSPSERTGQLPPGAMPAGMPADKTVRMCWPTQPGLTEVGLFSGLAGQLALWALAGISDLQIGQRAFELADDAVTSSQPPVA
jgi:hypothetical protein